MTRDESFVAAPRLGLLVALIAVVAALPFFGALDGPFLWDDTHLIEDNPRVHTFAHVSQLFTHSYFDTGVGATAHYVAYFRPISHLISTADWVLGKGNPAVFHTTNLLLAMIVAGLASDCLMRWTRSTYGALVCALLFAWHPSKAESVAWISGRTDLLVAGFILLASKARSKYMTGPRGWKIVELVASVFAYASKETAILLPLFIWLEHWSAGDRASAFDPRRVLSACRATGWHWLLAVVYWLLRATFLPLAPQVHTSTTHAPLSRLGLAFETFGRAARLLVYPFPQSAEHGLASFDEHSRLILSYPHVVLGAIATVTLCACAWLARKRAPAVALGCAMILVTQLPTANLIPTQLQCAFYERFLFLPTLGLALVVAAMMQVLATHRVASRVGLLTIAVTLAVFAVRSTVRTNDYTSAERFWKHESAVNPLSTIAPQGLAAAARINRDPDSAVRHLNQCHVNAAVRRQQQTAIRCAYDSAALIADRTPDLARTELVSVEHFFEGFINPDSGGPAELHLPKLTVRIDTSVAAVKEVIRAVSGESLAILSSIELRLNRPTATEHARLALASCRTCRYALRAARVLAATGHIDEALTAMNDLQREGPVRSVSEVEAQLSQFAYWNARALRTRGPEQVHARAQGYLALGLFGAAYETLRPHVHEFASIPTVNLQFAQIAYYAGDAPGARNTLLGLMGSTETEILLAAWGKAEPPSTAFP